MGYLFLFFFIGLLSYLFCVYAFGKDDFVLYKKNIGLEQIYNFIFVQIFVGLIFARVFYILFHPSVRFINPLVFLAFPYVPGLSLAGGIIGGILSILLIPRRKKAPKKRLIDLSAVAICITISIGFLVAFVFHLISKSKQMPIDLLFTFTFFVFFVILLRLFVRTIVKEGSVGLLFIAVFSLLMISFNIMKKTQPLIWILGRDELLLVGLLVISSFLFVAQEFFGFGRKLRK